MIYLILYYIKRGIKFLSEPIFFLLYVAIQFITILGVFIEYLLLTPYKLILFFWFFFKDFFFEKTNSTSSSQTSSVKHKKVSSKQAISFPQLTGLDPKTKKLLTDFSKGFSVLASDFNANAYNAIKEYKKGIDGLNKNIFIPIVSFFSKIFSSVLSFTWAIFRLLFSKGVVVTSLVLIIVFGGVGYWQGSIFFESLPDPNNIGKSNFSVTTHIFDRNQTLLYEVYRDENRTPIRLEELPRYVSQATLAIEDKDFYSHIGVAPINGVLRAIKETYLTSELQGGSTITQQLVKTSLLTPERTIERKIREMVLAVWAERIFDKNEILEMYLNQVPYGGEAYGVEEAANSYFDKNAVDLDLHEAALLAGLPQAPTLYSPYVNPEAALSRRNNVLLSMFEEGYITEDQMKQSISQDLDVVPQKIAITAPHFVFYIRKILEEQFGTETVEEGGLRVNTTLDLEVQTEVEKILKDEIAKVEGLNISNGAVLVTDPGNGEIIAMAGSVDYFREPDGAFNVTTALRQPGSTIKPLMYSLALENGYTAATLIDDVPTVIQIPGSQPYKPVNYDGNYRGKVPLRYALANSYNIPAVKVLQTLGVQRFVYHSEKLGIDTWKDSSRFGLSLTLGGGEVTMTDMAEAFGVFANEGIHSTVSGIKQITDINNEELLYDVPPQRRVIDQRIAFLVSDILSDSVARVPAFGTSSALEISGNKVAVKTGTTNDVKDNWTIGYTPDYLVVVWVGNNDNTPMNQSLVSGITGAAPIWNRVMTYLLERQDAQDIEKETFSIPEGIVSKPCYNGRTEYFLAGTENTVRCVLPKPPQPTQNPDEENNGDG